MEPMKTWKKIETCIKKSFETLLTFVTIIQLNASVFYEISFTFQLFSINQKSVKTCI